MNRKKLKDLIPVLAKKYNFRQAIVEKDYYMTIILNNINYKGNYKYNLGLDKKSIDSLYRQIETDLIPVIRIGEKFNLNKVFEHFNNIFNI